MHIPEASYMLGYLFMVVELHKFCGVDDSGLLSETIIKKITSLLTTLKLTTSFLVTNLVLCA